jgi:hypothetical protein
MGLLGVGRVNYDNRDGCVSVSALSIAGMYLRQTKPLVEVERFVSGHGFQPRRPPPEHSYRSAESAAPPQIPAPPKTLRCHPCKALHSEPENDGLVTGT